jgi:hypothetical protein
MWRLGQTLAEHEAEVASGSAPSRGLFVDKK